MLTTAPSRPFTLPAGSPPLLMVVIDTEEEFDWSGPFSRAHTATESLAAQPLAQEMFERWGIVPTYAIDWPVATSGLG
ncbi:MAG: glycosyltransferase, partial [Rhodospirillales bacterium]|nr:glycosyltransferase [Rhodospirillales bacterium]